MSPCSIYCLKADSVYINFQYCILLQIFWVCTFAYDFAHLSVPSTAPWIVTETDI